MRRITGTHVYGLFQCARKVALDLSEDRSRRRPLREEEEFVLQRGRDHEARILAELGWPEPDYEPGDWEQGARATAAMLADGVAGVAQGVLCGEGRVGIPDLLRREAGDSDFGDWHYVVGDVKSSSVPRGDQVMQVVFYAALLDRLQRRAPDYGYLILKDGREERFELRPFGAVLAEIEARIEALRGDPSRERPFLSRACETCHWSDVCVPELEAGDDLSLLPGMTRGVRDVLESVGVGTTSAVRGMVAERIAKCSHLEPTLLRRLRRAAEARATGRPLPERRSREHAVARSAFVHFLTDPHQDRVLFMGVLWPDAPDGNAFRFVCPPDRDAEWLAFARLVGPLPREVRLVHYGPTVPRWFEEHGHGRSASALLESRFVDLARRLRGAAVFPAPVFGLSEHVRHGLGRDPHRNGRAMGAALNARDPRQGPLWLRDKGLSDLEDLAMLTERWLGDADDS